MRRFLIFTSGFMTAAVLAGGSGYLLHTQGTLVVGLYRSEGTVVSQRGLVVSSLPEARSDARSEPGAGQESEAGEGGARVVGEVPGAETDEGTVFDDLAEEDSAAVEARATLESRAADIGALTGRSTFASDDPAGDCARSSRLRYGADRELRGIFLTACLSETG